nr:uncharacterized protein LOC121128202 isoform X3 [Lepeophtheirus salmonis]
MFAQKVLIPLFWFHYVFFKNVWSSDIVFPSDDDIFGNSAMEGVGIKSNSNDPTAGIFTKTIIGPTNCRRFVYLSRLRRFRCVFYDHNS